MNSKLNDKFWELCKSERDPVWQFSLTFWPGVHGMSDSTCAGGWSL